MNWETVTAELTKPLDTAHVKPPPKGKYGEYIEGWHAIAEANRIFGFDGWCYSLDALVKTNQNEKDGKHHVGYAATVTVTVGSVTRTDVGHGQGHHGSEGEAHDSAIKEAVTDALKRALRTFGNPFGLALYDKTKANVADRSAIRRDEAITADREAIDACDSVDELQAVWMTISTTWRSEFQCNPPPALVTAKDNRKNELQKKEAA